MDSSSGYKAEDRLAAYLEDEGHTILARNYKTRYGEIDIIFIDKDNGDLVFGEVKYRLDATYGEPYEYVSRAKLRRIEFTAEHFLSFHTSGQFKNTRIDVFSIKGNFELEHFKNVTS